MAQDPTRTSDRAATSGSVTDPVCRMQIDPNTSAGSSEYQGTRYFFCSVDCKTNFDREPVKYVSASQGGGGVRV